MDDEYVRYRQASMKGKCIIAKKFSKFYLNDFKPITNYEKSDVEHSRSFYRAFTVGGAIAVGYMSFKMRRIRIGAVGENAHIGKDADPMHNILNDGLMALFGYFVGHLLSCDYIYKSRQYVLQRIYFEQSRQVQDRT